MTTILLVDDEPDVLSVLSSLLQLQGFRVITARGGVRALEIVKTVRIDVLVSDVVMPMVDGLAVCRALRSQATTRDIRIVLYSASAAPPPDEGHLFDVFIPKPARFEDHLTAIQGLLASSSPSDSVGS